MSEAEWIAFLQRPEIPAFNRAMLERPEDDLPRLVFADWMDENCPDTDVNAAVRESVAGEDQQAVWPAQQDSRGVRLEFVRCRVRARIGAGLRPPRRQALRTCWEAVWRAGWVDHLLFHSVRFDMLNGWFADPKMEQVTSIGLPAFHLRPHQLASLLRSSHLSRLTSLGVNFERLSADFARVVANAPVTSQLRSLTVTSFHTDPPQLGILVTTPRVTGLQELYINAYRIDEAGAVALSSSPNLKGLKRLGIGGMTTDGAAALANSPYLCEEIRAWWRRVTDDGGTNP